MSYFLFIIFFFVGITGLVYKVDSGVFIGFGLIPWQIMRFGISKKLNLASIVITLMIGGIYFLILHKWSFLFLFIFIQAYNFWGFLNTRVKEQKN
jgi:hypothetical protein